MDDNKLMLGFFLLIGTCTIFLLASNVGIERAQTMKACYEAAKVNQNIKCEEK